MNEPTEKAPEVKPEDKKPEGAPEKYADFTFPEGFEANTEVMEKATTLFKELNLPQESAQKLVDFHSETMQQAANAPFEFWKQMNADWIKDIKSDPELGPKLEKEVRPTISQAIDSLGDPKLVREFREALDLTGAGNNPAFIRAFYSWAQRLTEGTHVESGKPSPLGQRQNGQPPTAAKALYPNLA